MKCISFSNSSKGWRNTVLTRLEKNALLGLPGQLDHSRSFRGDGLKYTEGLLILSVHGKEQRNRYSRNNKSVLQYVQYRRIMNKRHNRADQLHRTSVTRADKYWYVWELGQWRYTPPREKWVCAVPNPTNLVLPDSTPLKGGLRTGLIIPRSG